MRLIRSDCFSSFKARGVPANVLLAAFPENINKHINAIEIPKTEGTSVLDASKQKKSMAQFEKIIRAPKSTSKPLMCLAGRSYDFIPSQYALQIAANLIQGTSYQFYWHVLNGSTYDNLRDNQDFKTKVGDIRLLIISGLAENSTSMKLEKARDLLNQYSDVARILVVGGVDPVAFSKQSLHMRPDFFIYA